MRIYRIDKYIGTFERDYSLKPSEDVLNNGSYEVTHVDVKHNKTDLIETLYNNTTLSESPQRTFHNILKVWYEVESLIRYIKDV